jgi:hypothetical protein
VWEKPGFTEISMNAEIGAYQDDSDGGNVPIVEAPAADVASDSTASN